jgi:hypothetical protein
LIAVFVPGMVSWVLLQLGWSGAEKYYMDVGADCTTAVLKEALSKDPKLAKPKHPEEMPAEELNEQALDESRAYSAKVGKWIRGTLDCTGDPVFWFFVHVSNACRQPLMHFYAILCSETDMPIKALVCGRVAEIASEFDQMLATTHVWLASAVTAACSVLPEGSTLSAEEQHLLEDMGIMILLHNSSAFHRRIVKPLSERASQYLHAHGLFCQFNTSTISHNVLLVSWEGGSGQQQNNSVTISLVTLPG